MRNSIACIIAAVLLVSGSAQAQQSDVNVQRFDRQLETIRRNTRLQINPDIPLGERTYFDYGGFTSFTYLSLDNPELTNQTMRQEELGAYADLILDGTHEFFFRGRLFHRDFNPGDRFNSDGEDVDGRIDRLFYKFDLQQFQSAYKGSQLPGNITVKLGRDLALWGNGLTLSNDLDGGVVDLSYDWANLELIAGVTPLDTVDFDSARPRFDSRTQRALYGAMASAHVGEQRPYVYGLIQRDQNNDELTAADMIDGQPATPTRFHYDSYYLGIGSSGAITDRMSYGIEAVYEGGHTLSSSFTLNDSNQQVAAPQTRDRIEAYALDARVDYVLPGEHNTRLSGEALLASGSDNRISSTTTTYGGNSPNSVDRAFNAFGLLDVGTAFSPSVSNLFMLRAGASTFPFKESRFFRKMQLGTDVYWFSKLDDKAPIDEATTHHSWLGVEPDVYMNWQITSDVTLAARYGLFIPGGAIVNDSKMRQFIFVGLTVAF